MIIVYTVTIIRQCRKSEQEYWVHVNEPRAGLMRGRLSRHVCARPNTVPPSTVDDVLLIMDHHLAQLANLMPHRHDRQQARTPRLFLPAEQARSPRRIKIHPQRFILPYPATCKETLAI